MLKKAPESPRPVAMHIELGAYRIANAEEFGRNLLRLMEEGGKVMSGLLERADGKISPMSAASDLTEATKLFSEIAQHWVADPGRLLEAQGELARNFMALCSASLQRRISSIRSMINMAFKYGVMENWSIGTMDFAFSVFHHSSIPPLRYSNFPVYHSI